THVQSRPGRNDVILFNHERPADCGIRRVWLWDGRHIRRLRTEGPNADGTPRRRQDWVCHEVWSHDGHAVLYHGKYALGDAPAAGRSAGRSFIGRVSPAADDHVEVAFAPHLQRYGHFTPGDDPGLLVSDGYAEFPTSRRARRPRPPWAATARGSACSASIGHAACARGPRCAAT